MSARCRVISKEFSCHCEACVTVNGCDIKRNFSELLSNWFDLSVLSESSTRQVVSLTAVAIATGYAREDPFRIGGIRRKAGFYFILGASLRR
ncbi:hypothetical protein AVEN_12312-1 [Araneus ventricosus]|uniref:Uncharacterized protein n=1 Tax=Araneus ventricosus TaxID=182803 RepID=A0A4Y2E9A8_ARAVE|nr:hypothetical protein AVEN_12312-1 [Araneus ventricosus]